MGEPYRGEQSGATDTVSHTEIQGHHPACVSIGVALP